MKTVDIVLATYKPNKTYLIKQLKSLNDQTYPYINLIIRDDSDDNKEFETIKSLVRENITNFSYQILKNTKNFGSNRTFELLTIDSTANYIAYCDQDDIWEKEKIEKLVETVERKNALLAYSDLTIIDENDKLIAKSFKNLNKRLKHLYGENLFKYFLRRNSVTGCTMLIKSQIAKSAMPFCSDFYIHDHWLTLFASSIGKIAYIPEPLVKYRIHGGNQIGASRLRNIECVEDYYTKKLLRERERYKCILDNYKFDEDKKTIINEVLCWTEKRISFFEERNINTTISMIKNIKEDPQLILLEMAICLLPKDISKKIIKKIKK